MSDACTFLHVILRFPASDSSVAADYICLRSSSCQRPASSEVPVSSSAMLYFCLDHDRTRGIRTPAQAKSPPRLDRSSVAFWGSGSTISRRQILCRPTDPVPAQNNGQTNNGNVTSRKEGQSLQQDSSGMEDASMQGKSGVRERRTHSRACSFVSL